MSKEIIIEHLLKDKKIIDLYENYIMKSIPFEEWVRNMTEDLLNGGNKEKEWESIMNNITNRILNS